MPADQRIDDAFAVVDAGAPGVEVKYENRPAGETGSNGKLLLTGLRSYEKNRITIDPTELPVDAEVNMMEQTVVPADRSGVAVKINVETQAQSALVTFKDSNGAFIPVGSTGHINAGKEPFVVGYDGQAFLRNLKTANTVEINLGDQLCRASFPYRPAPGTQVTIEGVLCR